MLAQLWQVFPFDFHAYALDWTAIVRALLVVAAVSSAIGIIVQFVVLIRSVLGPDTREAGSP